MTRAITRFFTLSLLALSACEEEVVLTPDRDRRDDVQESLLIIKVNAAQGGFRLVKLFGGDFSVSLKGENCPRMDDYFSCHLSDLVEGAYDLEFIELPGYQTPDSMLVQFPEGSEFIGDYQKL